MGPEEKWHIQKGVPVAWIAALIVQAMVLVYSYAILTAQVTDSLRRVDKLETRFDQGLQTDSLVDNRITRIEEKLTNQTELLQSINNDLKSLLRSESIRSGATR